MTSTELLGRILNLGSRYVRVVQSAGEGPTIVLLGGCGVPYYQWDDVVAPAAPLATVRLDRPGLTGTPWPGALPTLAAEVATLLVDGSVDPSPRPQ